MALRHSIVTEDLDRVLARSLPWEMFSGKTVLVSGASGLLGGCCCEVLLRLNESGRLAAPVKVIAFSRRMEALAERFAAYAGRSDLVLLAGDVTSARQAGLEETDFVIHGASPATPAAIAADLLGTFEANVYGTKNMLEMVRKSRSSRFLFLSSGAVYGQLPATIRSIGETDIGTLDPLALRSAYEEGKRAGETLCRLYADQYGIVATMARINHTYGPGLKVDDDRSFAEFIHAVAACRPLVLHSDGSAVRYFCYLSDTVAGLFAILLQGVSGEAYNVSNEAECCSILELAKLMVDLFPERSLRIDQSILDAGSRQMIVSSRKDPVPLNTAKLKALGWYAEVTLPDGLRRTILSFQ